MNVGERGRALHLLKVGAKKRSMDSKKRVKKTYATKVQPGAKAAAAMRAAGNYNGAGTGKSSA